MHNTQAQSLASIHSGGGFMSGGTVLHILFLSLPLFLSLSLWLLPSIRKRGRGRAERPSGVAALACRHQSGVVTLVAEINDIYRERAEFFSFSLHFNTGSTHWLLLNEHIGSGGLGSAHLVECTLYCTQGPGFKPPSSSLRKEVSQVVKQCCRCLLLISFCFVKINT